MRWSVLISSVLLALAGECLAGNSYFVAASGDDANPGSQAKPWKTIQKAADTMVPGDTVTVLEGKYTDQRVTVTKSGKPDLPIIYQAKGTAVMKGFKVTADHIAIRGFEIADTDYVRWHNDVSAGVYVKGHHVIVENNYVHDATLNGIVLFATPEEPAATSDCIVRNNRLFRNEMAGINVSGRNNLIEGNEVWGSVQYHPKVLAAEGFPAKINGLDADGMRFFGRGHVIRKNYIHDIKYGPPGIDPAKGDYNDDPHIDCFQTWSDQYNEVGKDIVFEQNLCDNAAAQQPKETCQGFMIEGGAENLIIRNNIVKTFRGVNARTCTKLIVVNNTFVSDLGLDPKSHPSGVTLLDCRDPVIKNNLFYDMPGHVINVTFTGTNPSAKAVFPYIAKNMACRGDGKPVWEPYTYSHPQDFWNADPKLANPAKGDYHPRADSPAIGAGVELEQVKTDYDGRPRPAGKACAIGAFEYQAQQEDAPKAGKQAPTQPTSASMPASLPAADVERLARGIAAEAARPNGDAEGYPLPLLGHWNTGQRPGGFSPDWQMSMIQQGHYLLPWFQMPGPGKDSIPQSYYEKAIKQAARLHLPISFVATQWEHLLTDDPAYFNLPAERNPNVVTPEGKVLKKVCPFGPVAPWKEVGRKWTSTEMLAKIQQWYPDPPRVLFVSNNEHGKLTWKEAETSARYLAAYGKGRDDDFKRKVVADGWVERYRAVQQAMREALSDGWKDKAVFVGYEAFGPAHLGRWDGWMEYSLTTQGRIDPWPLAWDGGSPSYYTHNWCPCNDNTVWSPQIESMNWLLMLDEAWKLNPKFWWEISVWDGHEPKMDNDKRKTYAKLGQTANPARYGGFVRFGLWLLRPRVAREFRGWVDTVKYEGPYTEAFMAAVDQVHREPMLRAFWRKGRLAPNPNGQHPYQRLIPEEYQKSQRWYLLDTDLMPAPPWKLDTQIPVFALALELGEKPARQWLVYAHAPAGPRQAVKIDLPGYGKVTADVAVEGTFLVVDEAGATVRPLLPEVRQTRNTP